MDGQARELHPLEVKVLLRYRPGDAITHARLAADLGFKEGQANQALSWLAAKGFAAETGRVTRVTYELADLGRDWRAAGHARGAHPAPARRAWRAHAARDRRRPRPGAEGRGLGLRGADEGRRRAHGRGEARDPRGPGGRSSARAAAPRGGHAGAARSRGARRRARRGDAVGRGEGRSRIRSRRSAARAACSGSSSATWSPASLTAAGAAARGRARAARRERRRGGRPHPRDAAHRRLEDRLVPTVQRRRAAHPGAARAGATPTASSSTG